MGIVSGGGGGTFNGGTITNPLVINTGDPNTIPLQIKGSANNQNVDFLAFVNTDNAQPFIEVDVTGALTVNTAAGTTVSRLLNSGVVYNTSGVRSQVIPSGALSAFTPSSGVGIQNPGSRDVVVFIPVTFNPTAGAAATCLIELSPDNVTYTTLGTPTIPLGVTFDGTVLPIVLPLPSGFYVRLTVTNATIGTGHYW